MSTEKPLLNDRILRAARGEEVDRPPVWVMRQAGRYLPEFRELRKSHDFFTMCRTPELATEVTLQPLRRFPLDAVIIFSDILVIPQALGMTVEMIPGKGPNFPEPLLDGSQLASLNANVDVNSELGYVADAIKLTVEKLEGQVPCIGFCGAPWTCMCYMIEGGGSPTVSKAKKWLYTNPEDSHKLLKIIADVSIRYLVMQVKAGAKYLQVFDTSASHLSPQQFKEFAFPYLKYIATEVKKILKELDMMVPMCVFAKGVHYDLGCFEETEYDVVGLDWTIDPELARKHLPTKTLQGNLDPCHLYAPTDKIKESTLAMIQKFGGGKKGHICNLGHGMHPDFSPDHLEVFIDTVVNSNK